jgi:hypothetical protein
LWPGSTKDEKLARGNFREVLFDTRSWKAITERSPEELAYVAGLLKNFENGFNKSPETPIDILWDEVKGISTVGQESDVPL